jgi:hypothetical protein
MKPYFKFLKLNIAFVLALFLFAGCQQEEIVAPLDNENLEERTTTTYVSSATFYGLGTENTIHTYRSGPPATEVSSVAITGLRDGESVRAIDIRPATRVLYGITNMNFIYTINPTTGVATRVSQTPFTPALDGTTVGFDFNPATDRIRVITDKNQYLWISPVTGQVTSTAGASLSGPAVAINGSAFSNNYSGTMGTTLYNVDVLGDKLYRQSATGGTQFLVGSTGLDINGEGGFDIARSGFAYAVLLARSTSTSTVGTSAGEDQEAYRLYSIDLRSGRAKSLGKVRPMIGIAVQ